MARTDDTPPVLLSHDSLKPEKIDPEVHELFAEVDPFEGSLLVAFGWALADDLEKFSS